MATSDIDRRFTYHSPKGDQSTRYEQIRAAARGYATLLIALCPDSDERDTALDRLDETVMWANASIARNE